MNKSGRLDPWPGDAIIHHTTQHCISFLCCHFSVILESERSWYIICMWVNVYQTEQVAVEYLCILYFKLYSNWHDFYFSVFGERKPVSILKYLTPSH